MKCLNCNNEVEASNFCRFCGSPLTPLTERNVLPDDRKWKIMVTFGKSSSQNYRRAVSLAKTSKWYMESFDEGIIIHQAVYTSEFGDFEKYLALYEIVKNWKTTFIFVNGEMADRSRLARVNYCYGNKSFRQQEDYCYSNRSHYPNPFRCHNLGFSAWSDPWYGYYKGGGFILTLDKNGLAGRIKEYYHIYKYCPSFDFDYMIDVINRLPKRITRNQYDKLVKTNGPLYWENK